MSFNLFVEIMGIINKIKDIFSVIIGKIKGFIKKYGWKAGVAIFLYYLIRDVILYILLPYLIFKGAF